MTSNRVLDTTITVAYVNPPKEGKKRGTIKSTDGQSYGVWPNQIALFHVGATYDIEVETVQFNGSTLSNIKDARLVTKPTAVAAPMAGAGAAAAPRPGNNTYRETSATDAERMFVCANLVALIKAGEVKNDKRQLWETTQMLRGLWRATFGEGNTFLANEAGNVVRARG